MNQEDEKRMFQTILTANGVELHTGALSYEIRDIRNPSRSVEIGNTLELYAVPMPDFIGRIRDAIIKLNGRIVEPQRNALDE